jgi:dTDP-4-amino-4,6-dideoxygalactose transaminase
VERAEILHEKGTNRRAFFRGHVDKYSWVDLGSSFVASELAAAFLWAQLEHDEWITAQRMAVWERYDAAFADLESAGALRRPVVPAGHRHNAHMYYLLMPSGPARDRAIAELHELGITAVFHYVPLHSAPAGRRLGRAAGLLSVTDDVSARLLRLPLWVGMSDEQVERVITSVRQAARG